MWAALEGIHHLQLLFLCPTLFLHTGCRKLQSAGSSASTPSQDYNVWMPNLEFECWFELQDTHSSSDLVLEESDLVWGDEGSKVGCGHGNHYKHWREEEVRLQRGQQSGPRGSREWHKVKSAALCALWTLLELLQRWLWSHAAACRLEEWCQLWRFPGGCVIGSGPSKIQIL